MYTVIWPWFVRCYPVDSITVEALGTRSREVEKSFEDENELLTTCLTVDEYFYLTVESPE